MSRDEHTRSCPDCGSPVYPEPMIRGGTRREFHAGYCSGYACTECSWSETLTDPGRASTGECDECGTDTDTSTLSTRPYGVCRDCTPITPTHRRE